ARSLAEKLTFGDDRIEVFVTLYPKVIDPENSHVFYGALVHGSDKEKLEKRLDALSR
ncbi:MAG: DUF4476 domain-containing protein, partial [Myxococcales bacterium]|nr:DUF4476 domain-containing protein [Myxococcales bacterium]